MNVRKQQSVQCPIYLLEPPKPPARKHKSNIYQREIVGRKRRDDDINYHNNKQWQSQTHALARAPISIIFLQDADLHWMPYILSRHTASLIRAECSELADGLSPTPASHSQWINKASFY